MCMLATLQESQTCCGVLVLFSILNSILLNMRYRNSNPDDEWVVASVAEDNVLQIWRMADCIYNEEDEQDPVEEAVAPPI